LGRTELSHSRAFDANTAIAPTRVDADGKSHGNCCSIGLQQTRPLSGYNRANTPANFSEDDPSSSAHHGSRRSQRQCRTDTAISPKSMLPTMTTDFARGAPNAGPAGRL